MFCDYNKKQKEDASRVIDLEDASIMKERCEFKRTQIYEHIDDQIKKEDPFTSWLEGVDHYNKEYSVWGGYVRIMIRSPTRRRRTSAAWRRRREWRTRRRSRRRTRSGRRSARSRRQSALLCSTNSIAH